MSTYFNCHSHTMYSNLRLLDSINRPEDLIRVSKELGLSGLAITDHEALSSHMIVNQIAKKMREENPDFTIALGNEIYLTDTRDRGQKYYHFILIAKDAIGYKQIKKLSSMAWYYMYEDRRMERVPTLKSELEEVILENPGHLIATSACIGGELSTLALNMARALLVNDTVNSKIYYQDIEKFLDLMKKLFGSDFWIECAPSDDVDQITVNKELLKIAQNKDFSMVIGTDAHYLRPEDKHSHKVYLTSKDGERETDAFYKYTYVMSPDECRELLRYSYDDEVIDTIFNNTQIMQSQIEFFDLTKKQRIRKEKVKDYPKGECLKYFGANNDFKDELDGAWKIIKDLALSDEIQERYWINECINSLLNKNLWSWEYIDRIRIEAETIQAIGKKLETSLFPYFNTFQHYIDLFWECGSIVGPGRGSSTGFLSNYLLGITQLDSIRWELPYWRFLNSERAELPDIDIDLAPSKRPFIFQKIREQRGGDFSIAQVVAFGTEKPKSAILAACRGYRSPEYPNGIDVDLAQYMSSLVPEERGFLWDIKDIVYGNKEKDRQPVKAFIDEVNKYEGLLDIIMAIDGLVNKRTVHASGVVLYDEDPYDTAAFMRSPGGDITTCWDLHDAEAAGDTKYDFLATDATDKMIQCYELLCQYGLVHESLRDFYNEHLHPEVMDLDNPEIWDHLSAGDVLDIFQFSTDVGLQIAKKLKPRTINEMMAASALMRLMSEKDTESAQDRYVRIKNDPQSFELEMIKFGLNDTQRAAFHKHCDVFYGTVPIQEQMMQILMDPDIGKFTLGEANTARKIVAKKKMKQIPELRTQLYERVQNSMYADYIWRVAIAPSLGYAFSKNHSLPYSFIGVQMIYLATHWNSIFWNTACLIVNSGATDQENSGSTDYEKIAKAIGNVKKAGIEVNLLDINKSAFGFVPDVENNRILFGLKGTLNVGDDLISTIEANRPYSSPKDFYNRVKPKKQAMIALIKGGAFDAMEDRKFVMAWFIWHTCDKKSRLTLQNMPSLLKYDLIPFEDEKMIMGRRIYEFNRYLKACCKTSIDTKYYHLDERALNFMFEIEQDHMLFVMMDDYSLNMKEWDKYYQKQMDIFRNWIAADKDNILFSLNAKIFSEDWLKYADKSYSSWEMEVCCFYYHEHELAHVNMDKYGLSDFEELSPDPIVDRYFPRNGRKLPLFKLSKICGTCIAKNKTKSIVTLLTTSGVVNVKFRKEYFSLFDKRISEVGADGKKHIIEKSWFSRGSMIVVNGMRSGDTFISKKYASTQGHQLYKIDKVLEDGSIILRDKRYQGEEEDDDE